MPVRLRSVWPTRVGSVHAIACAAFLLAGCASSTQPGGAGLTGQISGPNVVAEIHEVDLRPRYPQSVKSGEVKHSNEDARGAIYFGDATPGTTAVRSPGSGRNADKEPDPETTGAVPQGSKASDDGKGYEINFENTPVATAAKAVLGDILGVGYTVDPRIQGTVSVASGRPVPKKDLVFVLESALRVNNVAVVRDGQNYRLVPTGEASGTGAIDRDRGLEAGYGISVVPLQFVSAQTLIKLLENFAAKPGMARADFARNLLIIQGNGADRRAAIETALSFDADWMRGQSVGIFPVSNSMPEPIITELERIIDSGQGGLSQNVVKLQPISRQNSILVVTRKPELLKTVSTWISRLDKSGGAGTGVRVYRMHYGDAKKVAALLNDIFIGGQSNVLESPSNQLIPGGGAVASSSDRPNQTNAQGATASLTGGAASGSRSSSAQPSFDSRLADAGGGRSMRASADASGGGLNNSSGGGTGSANSTPLFPNVRITADPVNNALVIYANQEHYRIIERTIQQIDRPQLQVAIDATIAEITLNDELRYGVQFFLKSKDVGLKPDKGSASLNTAMSAATNALISRAIPGFNFLVGTETDPSLIIEALHSVTQVKVLSTPSVVVVDNQVATLQVGDEIPIITRTAKSVEAPTAPIVNNIDYRNTGVILRVAPRIHANGNVLLDVDQEISAIANSSPTGTLTPTVSQRRVSSSISVASGQTVLLGGLMSERHDRGRSGLPGLHQIPGFGELFAQNAGQIQRTELIIFIRPRIIRSGADAAHIAEELRAKLRGGGYPVVPLPMPGKAPVLLPQK